MVRWILAMSLAVVAGCAGGDERVNSSPDSPTTSFEYENPEVDTGWPESQYDGARSRPPESGWRVRLRD